MRHHGPLYFDWSHEAGEFGFFEYPVHSRHEQADEGKYPIQTEEPDLSSVDAV
jgi:hypothetical protein